VITPQPLKRFVPKSLRSGGLLRQAATILGHVLFDYGWLRSYREKSCVDRNGEPIPWFTYPAIDYLGQLDLSQMDVFEWGSGYSTAYWSKWARSVVSIETDPEWAQRVSQWVGSNCRVLISDRELEIYVGQIFRYDSFDLIVVDGTGESRRECARAATQKLSPNGIIVLDNSDLWPDSARIIREHDLIEVDFSGFSPASAHCHTTSVFLSPTFRARPRAGIQPTKSGAQPSEPWPGQ
jgi:hypothetical protein